MTVRHLKLFLEVYKLENITQAARNLNMTQPTVTRAIQELEEHYSVRLFDRINKHIYPTEAGKKLYRYAGKMLEAFEYMEESMQELDAREIIKIGATASIGSSFLPKLIVEFRRLHPDVLLKSVVENGAMIHNLLVENQLDFALIEGFVSSENLQYEVFSEDRLVLLLPPDDPRSKKDEITLDELKNDAFLLREKGSVGRNYVDVLFSSHGLPIEPVMESFSNHAIVQAVHNDIGIAILPESLVKHSIESGFVSSCHIKDIDLVRQNYIAWHEGKYLTPKTIELIDLCRRLDV